MLFFCFYHALNEAGSYQCVITDTLMMMTVRLAWSFSTPRQRSNMVKYGEDETKVLVQRDVCLVWCDVDD